MMENIPAGIRAGAILADPGIAFQTRSRPGEGRCPQSYYTCNSFAELAAMPVASIAARDCFLFLWIPLRSTPLVEPLMLAWGFPFGGSAFALAKLNKKGPGWRRSTPTKMQTGSSPTASRRGAARLAELAYRPTISTQTASLAGWRWGGSAGSVRPSSPLKPNEQNVVIKKPDRVARWGKPTPGGGGFFLSVYWKLGGTFV